MGSQFGELKQPTDENTFKNPYRHQPVMSNKVINNIQPQDACLGGEHYRAQEAQHADEGHQFLSAGAKLVYHGSYECFNNGNCR